ncbi:CPBP family intramembrane glutamic endopeptidase [Actinoalloteichus hymeniacidonis]|uniref:CPBP family intramembrane glutamic endopeptidase n=1 Tax=Actinoalloteichus hymeniacidonis TaxID=340345 RepID=UPI00184CF96D|nr:CPBP family intramembrane glutamic endopeptidase [Actinoalloteichus hymeniacidonis]MBB5907012.1 hypothetical protein [Actinoalloteichus hymeniacidonis]
MLTALAALAATPLLLSLLSEADAAMQGLALAAWSVFTPFAGFAVAALVRIRGWAAFGVTRTTWRWLLIAVAVGVGTFIVKGFVNMGAAAVFGIDGEAQLPYVEAAGSGLLPLILTFAFISLFVPIGEELLFRGVLMRGLLRYGPVVAVLSSTIVFALFHGVNLALPSAVVFGIATAEIARRSGSIWPAVVVHVINNLALPVFAILAM